MQKRIPKLYMIVGVAFVVLVALYISFHAGIPLFVLAVIMAGIVGAFIYIGYLITPLITRIFNITYKKGEYVFPPGQDVIIKKIGNKYIAAKYLLMNIPEREEVSGRGEERMDVYLQDFENAIASMNVPAKISLLMSTKDVSAYRESVQAKVYEYSLRIKREMEKAEPDVIKIDRWQKEKDVYENLLKRLAGGVKPIGAVMYAATFAKGITPQEARDKALSQAREIKAVLSNNLNVEVIDLVGEDAEMCLDWEFVIPTSYDELIELTG
ncbi:MAG: hypothetical protein ACP5H8_02565 [Candidatus Micrarchaeia archaeon]